MKNTETNQNLCPDQTPGPAEDRTPETAGGADPLFLLPAPADKEPASDRKPPEAGEPDSSGAERPEDLPEIPEETSGPDLTEEADPSEPDGPSEEDQILAAPEDPEGPEETQAAEDKTRRSLWSRPWFSKLLLVVAILGVTAAIILGRSLWQLTAVLQERNEEIAELHENVHERDAKITELNRTIESNEDELKLLRNGPNTMLQKVQAAFAQEDWEKAIDLADQLHELYPGNANDVAAQRLKKQAKAALDAEKKAAEKKKKAADSED